MQSELLLESGIGPHTERATREAWDVSEHDSDKILVMKGPTFVEIDKESLFHRVIGGPV